VGFKLQHAAKYLFIGLTAITVITLFVGIWLNIPTSYPGITIPKLETFKFQRATTNVTHYDGILYINYHSKNLKPATIFEIDLNTHKYTVNAPLDVFECAIFPSRDILITKPLSGKGTIRNYSEPEKIVHTLPFTFQRYAEDYINKESTKVFFTGELVVAGNRCRSLYFDLDTMRVQSTHNADIEADCRLLRTEEGDLFATARVHNSIRPSYKVFSSDQPSQSKLIATDLPGGQDGYVPLGYSRDMGWVFSEQLGSTERIFVADDVIDLPREYGGIATGRRQRVMLGYFIYDDRKGITVLDLETKDNWRFKVPKEKSTDHVGLHIVSDLKGVVVITETTIYLLRLDGNEPEIVPFKAPS